MGGSALVLVKVVTELSIPGSHRFEVYRICE